MKENDLGREMTLQELDASLGRRQLIVVTGKGGVGKSVLSAVLGQRLAQRGQRTLLLEVDRRENLHQLLGVPPSDGEVVDVAENLFLQNLKPSQVVNWVLEQKVKIRPLIKRIQKSPVYQRFVEGAPGLSELAIVGHALRWVRGEFRQRPAMQTVILDAPATGHGLALLRAPKLVAEAIGSGPFFDLAKEAADFVEDPERTSVVVVTLAEEMPTQEALELRQGLLDHNGDEPKLLVVNGLYPPWTGGEKRPPLATTPLATTPLEQLWQQRRRVNDNELQRLAEHWPGPKMRLPLLPIDQGQELVDALSDAFAEALSTGEGSSA